MPNTGDIVRASDFQAIKPQLSIGTVTTGAAGSNASASITGTSPNFKLNLTIPRGANGTNGTNGTSGIMFSQVFTSSTTVTVPSGATKAVLTGCGGGGGGNRNNAGSRVYKGGIGGSIFLYPVNVSAGTSIKITIGGGGAAAASANTNGSAGGATSFGSLMTVGGGGGATSNGSGATGSSPSPLLKWQHSFYGTGGTGAGYGQTPTAGKPGILIVIWSR